MIRLIAFGLAFGAAFQAWRNFPADGPITSDSLAVVFVAGVLCAFAGGFFMGKPWRVSATATATANAAALAASRSQAQSAATVNLIMAHQGGAAPVGMSIPSPETVSWMGERPALSSVEDLDGMDLSDLVTEQEYVEQPG